VNAEHIVDVEVNFNPSLCFNELQDGDSAGRHIDQCPFPAHVSDDSGAHLDKLVLVVPQFIREDGSDIDV
jgi:hypothetical protein